MTNIHTIARQLTDWHTHRQPYTHERDGTTWQTAHVTHVPPLLQQLDNADKRPADIDAQRGTPTSRPAANIEALDTLSHIDNEAAAWVRRLGHDDPGDAIACVRKVYSLAASAHFCQRDTALVEDVELRVKIDGKWEIRTRRHATCCDVHRIERDMRTWWTQARICSGWDTPAWKPNNTCPVCSERRTLRIRPDDRDAFCVGCRETWTEANIGLLAEHVRLENGDDEVVVIESFDGLAS